MPVLLKLPIQPPLSRPKVCVPGAFLFRVPALVNSGCPKGDDSGVAFVVSMLNTPPGWLVNEPGVELEVLTSKRSWSSPPSVTVPALSQRRSSLMRRLPPLAARLMLVVEPAGVSSVPLPRRLAWSPLAVSAPVTATVPLPPRAALAPESVRLVKVVVDGELMLRPALFTVRLPGSVMAPKVDARPSVPPVRLIDGTDRSFADVRLAVPAESDTLGTLSRPPAFRLTVPLLLLARLATLRLPPALTVSDAPPATVTAGSVVAGPPPEIVTMVVTLAAASTAIEAAPIGAALSVRVPAAKPMPEPGAIT